MKLLCLSLTNGVVFPLLSSFLGFPHFLGLRFLDTNTSRSNTRPKKRLIGKPSSKNTHSRVCAHLCVHVCIWQKRSIGRKWERVVSLQMWVCLKCVNVDVCVCVCVFCVCLCVCVCARAGNTNRRVCVSEGGGEEGSRLSVNMRRERGWGEDDGR